jgi:hypothetical protein
VSHQVGQLSHVHPAAGVVSLHDLKRTVVRDPNPKLFFGNKVTINVQAFLLLDMRNFLLLQTKINLKVLSNEN